MDDSSLICCHDMWTKDALKCSITDFKFIILTFWICSFIVMIFSSVLIFFFSASNKGMSGHFRVKPSEKACVHACMRVCMYSVYFFLTGLHFLVFFASRVICSLLGGVAFNTHLSFSSIPRSLATCFTIDTWIQPLSLLMPLTSLTCRQEASLPQTSAEILAPLQRCSNMQLPIRCFWEIMLT